MSQRRYAEARSRSSREERLWRVTLQNVIVDQNQSGYGLGLGRWKWNGWGWRCWRLIYMSRWGGWYLGGRNSGYRLDQGFEDVFFWWRKIDGLIEYSMPKWNFCGSRVWICLMPEGAVCHIQNPRWVTGCSTRRFHYACFHLHNMQNVQRVEEARQAAVGMNASTAAVEGSIFKLTPLQPSSDDVFFFFLEDR